MLGLDGRVEDGGVHAAGNGTRAESHVALLCDELCREMCVDWKVRSSLDSMHLFDRCVCTRFQVLQQCIVPL